MKRFNPFWAGICILLFTACTHRTEKVNRHQTVKIDTVLPADEHTVLQYPGKVKAAQDISLAFRVSGTLQKVHVEEGSRVRAGQLLAELDPTDYRVQLDATEAEYRQVKAEAERVMALYQENGTTPNANDKAVYGLKQITAKYQHHKDRAAYTRLYAPFDGFFVQQRLFEAHETVGAGMPVLSIISAGTPEVEINLPAAEYIHREKFSRYHCTFDIYPGRHYALKPVSITPKANANQLYAMRLQMVPDGQPVPSPGMNTMVTIYYETDGVHSLYVPGGAVLQKDGKAQVFVYEPGSRTVQSRQVSIVRLLTDGQCIVTSDGLKPGDLVVASGVHHIKDGDTVEPLPAVSQTNVGGLL